MQVKVGGKITKSLRFVFLMHFLLFSINTTAIATEPSTSPNVVDVNNLQFFASFADESNPITFSEYPTGTYITDQYANQGIIFGGDTPFISPDGSNPTSPVLSGSPLFTGAIEGRFVWPDDGVTPATVTGFSLDAGYFDALNSTRIEWFDLQGNKLGEQINSMEGIEHFVIEDTGIASWRMAIITTDPAGFAIDNVAITGDIGVLNLLKTDDVDDGDCREPGNEIEYTISWENISGEIAEDVILLDTLPRGVDFVDFVESTAYPSATPPVDPNLVFSITDVNGLDTITLPVGQSVRLYVTKQTVNTNIYGFTLEVNSSDPNLGWIDNTEYDPNNPWTAEILATPRDTYFDYYGPGYTQPEGIQFSAVSFGTAMQDGNLASFLYTASQLGYVTLTLIDYDTNPATLESIIIRQTDPNDPNNIPSEPNSFNEPPVYPASSPTGSYYPLTHTITWLLGDISVGGSGSVKFKVRVNVASEPGMTLHNVAELISQEQVIARATEDTPVCCWDTDDGIIYVNDNATGYNNGISWANAYTDLQRALIRLRAGCENIDTIFIADGKYNPGLMTGDTFNIPDNVSIYGGFAGWESSPDQRYIKIHPTILTGCIDPNNHNETVVTLGNNILLDGVIVKDGDDYGVLGIDVDFDMSNCVIENIANYGVYAENGNISANWSLIQNNGYDGIRYIGNGKSIVLENCQINDNQRNGLLMEDSFSVIRNSIVCRNGSNGTEYYGIFMSSPSDMPQIYNITLAYNHNAAFAYTDSDPNHVNIPDIQNSIIWYNNEQGNGEQFAGWKVYPRYSCVCDPNDPDGVSETIDWRNNFSHKPDFAYLYSIDPNVCINVHLAPESFCKNKGNPSLSYADQNDLDNEGRVAEGRVDVGADEVSCADVYNPWDWDADGIVNLNEFEKFSIFWLAHDPNDPALLDPNDPMYEEYHDPNSPYYISPESQEQWHSEGYQWNFVSTNGSMYSIDTADLLVFLDDSPWLWVACWRHDIQDYLSQTAAMGQQMMAMSSSTESLNMTESVESIPLSSAMVVSGTNEFQSAETAVSEPVEVFDPVAESEQISSLLKDIEVFIDAGGDDADPWKEIKILLEQSLADIEDMINIANEN